MDSIFYVQINQNKLQNILNQIIQSQQQHNTSIIELQNKENSLKTLMNVKMEISACQIQEKLTNLEGRLNEQLKEELSVKADRQAKIQERNKEIQKICEELNVNYQEKQMKVELLQNNTAQILDKIDRHQVLIKGLMEQMQFQISTTKFLQNQSFKQFLEYLIDKETQKLYEPKTKKVNIQQDHIEENDANNGNPFHQKKKERQKKLKQLKDSIGRTETEVKKMEVQFEHLRVIAEEQAKQTRNENRLNYAIFSTKLKQIQDKCDHQTNFFSSKFSDFPRVRTPRPSYLRKGTKDQLRTSPPTERYFAEFSSQVAENLDKQNFNNLVDQKKQENLDKRLEKIEDDIWWIRNKQENFAEKVNKIQQREPKDKRKSRFVELTNEDHKNKMIMIEMKKMEERVEESLEDQKINFKNSLAKVNEMEKTIMAIRDSVGKKANRQEIKQAFIFLEGKISEIVILISGMQNVEKKSAITKQVVECLSCNRQFYKDYSNDKKIDKSNLRSNKTARFSLSKTHRKQYSNRLSQANQ